MVTRIFIVLASAMLFMHGNACGQLPDRLGPAPHPRLIAGDSMPALRERLRNDGYRIVGEPRTTGDGFYESVIADPDGNLIELTYDNGR